MAVIQQMPVIEANAVGKLSEGASRVVVGV